MLFWEESLCFGRGRQLRRKIHHNDGVDRDQRKTDHRHGPDAARGAALAGSIAVILAAAYLFDVPHHALGIDPLEQAVDALDGLGGSVDGTPTTARRELVKELNASGVELTSGPPGVSLPQAAAEEAARLMEERAVRMRKQAAEAAVVRRREEEQARREAVGG